MSEADAIRKAKDVFSATEWSGDIRVNFNTLNNAGKTIVRELERLEAENREMVEDAMGTESELDRLRDRVVSLEGEVNTESGEYRYAPL